MNRKLLARISVDPRICGGKPCIKGHRIWVSLILDYLAAGWTHEQMLKNFPGIETDDILACIAYGGETSRAAFVDVPIVRRDRREAQAGRKLGRIGR
jgi:uncharacterized protein (DUF433 family)